MRQEKKYKEELATLRIADILIQALEDNFKIAKRAANNIFSNVIKVQIENQEKVGNRMWKKKKCTELSSDKFGD